MYCVENYILSNKLLELHCNIYDVLLKKLYCEIYDVLCRKLYWIINSIIPIIQQFRKLLGLHNCTFFNNCSLKLK